MSIDLNALATWTYDAGTLKKLSVPTSTIKFDPLANPDLHKILSQGQWATTGSKEVYSSRAEDWKERRIDWKRIAENPVVVSVEQGIGKGDFVAYAIKVLEDVDDYKTIFDSMAATLNDGRVKGFTASHIEALVKNLGKVIGTVSDTATSLSASKIGDISG